MVCVSSYILVKSESSLVKSLKTLHFGDEDGPLQNFIWAVKCIYLSNAQGLKPFDCSETAGVSVCWERWLCTFELFAMGKGVENVDQNKALLLHTAGLNVQDNLFHVDLRKEDQIATCSSWPVGSIACWQLCFCCGGLLQLILLDGIYQIYTTSEWIVSMLSKIFITHGLPLCLRTDNWP